MTLPLPTGLYGTPPPALATPPGHALQLSALIPGSADLAEAAPESFGELLIHAPPGTLERRFVLAHALRTLAPGGTLTALAPSNKGGARLMDELTAFGCTPESRSKARHRILTTQPPSVAAGLADAITAGAARLDANLGLWTQPGVFSWDRPDPGTRLLCARLPALSGAGADLGSGLGILARHVLTSSAVTRLDLIEIDRRAVACALRNVTIPRAHHHWADATATPPSARRTCDFVVMNPPFHAGGSEDKTLGQAFIRAASARLKPGGVCWLVANRHLPYEAGLREAFRTVRLDHEAEGFKVFEART